MFNSKTEICREFNIEFSENTEEIIKKLTKLQQDIHPDITNTDEQISVEMTRLTEAKKYLRELEKSDNQLVSVSAIRDIITAIKNDNYSSNSLENIEKKYLSSCEDKFRSIKKSFLPHKITLSSIMAVISFVWLFPSLLKEHPIVGQIFFNDSLYFSNYLMFTGIWVFIMYGLSALFFVVYQKEKRIKHILYQFEDLNFQYNIFLKFLNKNRNESFTQVDLEEYIFKALSENNKRRKSFLKLYAQEIFPEISKILLLRAVDKGIIVKTDDVSWYDNYVISEKVTKI